jgi:hypothetical protein
MHNNTQQNVILDTNTLSRKTLVIITLSRIILVIITHDIMTVRRNNSMTLIRMPFCVMMLSIITF